LKGKNILLISHGPFEKEFLEDLSNAVSAQIHVPVDLVEDRLDLGTFYDPDRRQYNANGILQHIESISSPKHLKKIGLFRIDLFIPILTYIFGQGALNGTSGVASLYRLRNEQYGMIKNEALLLDRFKKVVIHELGHTFGLIHCHNPTCVMLSSTYVEDIDQKDQAFCPSCQNELYSA